jgi:hypothetical protein
MSVNSEHILQHFSIAGAVAALEENLVAYIMYCSCVPGAKAYHEFDHIAAITGIPQPSLNVVMRSRFTQNAIEERIAQVMQPFKERRVPMLWRIFPGTEPVNLGQYLIAHGLTAYENEPGMAVELAALPQDMHTLAGLTIEEVESKETLNEWIETAALAFNGNTQEIDPHYVTFEQCLGWGRERPYQRFLARLYGRAVATSAMFLGAGVAGLYSVGTLPELRRLGIGRAVSLAPLLSARAIGYHIGVLEASPMGYNIYARLGFQEYCRFHSYLWHPI